MKVEYLSFTERNQFGVLDGVLATVWQIDIKIEKKNEEKAKKKEKTSIKRAWSYQLNIRSYECTREKSTQMVIILS